MANVRKCGGGTSSLNSDVVIQTKRVLWFVYYHEDMEGDGNYWYVRACAGARLDRYSRIKHQERVKEKNVGVGIKTGSPKNVQIVLQEKKKR